MSSIQYVSVLGYGGPGVCHCEGVYLYTHHDVVPLPTPTGVEKFIRYDTIMAHGGVDHLPAPIYFEMG